MDYVINHTICKHIHLTATCAADSLQVPERVTLTKYQYVIQEENKLTIMKDEIHQTLSRIHVLTKKCSSLHELKLVA
jgi:hypothetical protein